MMSRASAVLVALAAVVDAARIGLVTFDGRPGTSFAFKQLNDPVMGGRSAGTWSVKAGAYGVMDGEVVDVPSLKAPGFIKAAADGKFADASSAADGDLVLKVRSSTANYSGFRISFASGTMAPSYACAGGGSLPLSRGCFKTRFAVPAGPDFAEVRVPLRSFSDKWSPATGEQTTTCAEDEDVCPTAKRLAAISRVELWAEGVSGTIHLEVQSIVAESREATPPRPPAEFDTCSGPVQPRLRYNISSRTTPTVPVAVSENETLATAVCCDSRTKVFAEPEFMYEAPDIALFSHLGSGVTTFYDSVCGIPLFRAPVSRTLADFQADSKEHGWPSFRSAEVVRENVRTNTTTGFVYSACGTHLGSYLPDEAGDRWCMDLSCIAGEPTAAAHTATLSVFVL